MTISIGLHPRVGSLLQPRLLLLDPSLTGYRPQLPLQAHQAFIDTPGGCLGLLSPTPTPPSLFATRCVLYPPSVSWG